LNRKQSSGTSIFTVVMCASLIGPAVALADRQTDEAPPERAEKARPPTRAAKESKERAKPPTRAKKQGRKAGRTPTPGAPPRRQPPGAGKGKTEADKPPAGRRLDGKPGVIDRSGDKKLDPRFDPKTLGQTKDQPKPEDVNVIKVEQNFGDKYPCKKIPLDAMVSIDFEDLKLADFTKLISCLTGKRFMLAQGVSGQITIFSPEPVTMYEAYKAFLSALEANNLTVVERGKFLRVIPKAKARTEGAPIGRGGGATGEDRMVTRLISVKHVLADEVKTVIQAFASDGADISVYGPTNTLIITEIGSNFSRLMKLIREVDKPLGTVRIWIRPLQHAAAADIAKSVESVFSQKGKKNSKSPSRPATTRNRARNAKAATSTPATGSSIGTSASELSVQSDERTNQLIIITDRATYMRVDKFIRKIDIAVPGEGQIHIHHLENANAKDVQTTLQALAGSGSGSTARSSRSSRRSKAAAAKKGVAQSAAKLGEDVKITAHEQTNSLLIEASHRDYLTLKAVIRQLDVRRKQVYLESVIMEITSDKDRQLGLEAYGGASFDVGGQEIPLIFGNSLGPNLSGLQDVMPGGFGAMLLGPLIDANLGSSSGGASTIQIPGFGFTMKALQSNSDVNILQTPHILTTDNEEAEIEVGRRVPFNGGGGGGLSSLAGLGLGGLGSGGAGLGGLGSLGTSLGALSGLGTIQYADIKISLKIKPTVNESNFVRLEIEQQIDDFDGIDQRTGAPNTSNRRVKNIVVVRDQQPVVIGGLMNDRETEGVRKVPILGDIPLLGALFRQTTTKIERKNLLMIIIPHIIDDPSDLKRIHEQRMQEIRDFAEFLATRRKEYLGRIDYNKKHGLLQEMHQTVESARADRYQLEQQLFDDSEIDPVGPADTHDLDYDPYEVELQRKKRGR
jgi:general secretion pathway protein D